MMTDTPEQVPHVLACDVGNSAIHFAYVHGDAVTEVQSLRVGELAGLGAAIAKVWQQIPDPKKLVACSVNAAGLKALEAAAMDAVRQPVLVIGRDVPPPIDTDLLPPATGERSTGEHRGTGVGMDRLCAAVAAFDRIGTACVVIDLGTAITVDCISDAGVFLGGAILPGLRMGVTGLHRETAQLPEVELVEPDWVFGKSTVQAIVGGLVFGTRGALKELIESYATELGHWPTVILTGGDAPLIGRKLLDDGLVQAIVPDLVLRGVAMAYYRTLLK